MTAAALCRAGSKINHSVIGLRTLINENCIIDDALIMGADYYETLEECALVPGCLPMGLGEQHLHKGSHDIGLSAKILGRVVIVTGMRDSEQCCCVTRGCLACTGANTQVRRCIIDKNARIGSNCKIINTANVQEANKEEDGYVIKDGIVVVIKSSVFPGALPASALASCIGGMATDSRFA